METSVSTPSFPRLNEPAPAFEAPTTAGLKKLSDYAGEMVSSFSHPADLLQSVQPNLLDLPRSMLRFRR